MSTMLRDRDQVVVLGAVRGELADFLRSGARHGLDYAKAYTAWWLAGANCMAAPRPPQGLPREVAAAIREMVREQALLARRLVA